MPRKANKPSQPASAPYPSRPPSQAPPPPANPNADRLSVSDIEVLLEPKYGGQIVLSTFGYDSQENRAIMDAGAKTPPRAPSPPPCVPTPPLPVLTRSPSPPRTPSPSASVLSSKRPISPGSSLSGPSVAAVSVCDSEDSSMVIEYDDATTPRPASPADEEHLDSMEAVKYITELVSDSVGLFKVISSPNWEAELLEAFPALMDNNLNVEAPASAVDAPAPRVIPRDAPPQAESAKSKPPKKKVRVDPAPSSDVTNPATAPLMEVDELAAPSSASGKAPTKPLPIPSSKHAPPPSSAPSVSFRAPSAPRKRRQGKHTSHGALRRAIILTPHADSPVTAASFTPEVINNLN
ncbi:hypothetical protein Agabi119p4_5761 [Agaricus bisporus var. burnettii]|uniref:Uncharacterized protein n=1 Tax=Agaricus bisporus var. burnettii TaxID=192524 RepID=A0A8H7KGV0_AGABI|nr:hypothetical protein Agabi119p4_5761 [Agaricus bisporus var. burnettii]